MKDCMVYLTKVCWRDQPAVASQAKTIVDATYKKEEHCGQTSFELPTMPPGNDFCSASFDNDISNCVQSFEQKFRKDKSDSALCSEYAKAKKCSRDVIDSDCNYPSETKELLDLLYDAYNPFCADNRDPGATKNSPCSGVVIEKDANAAAGTKPSVFQALMFAFFLFLFLFKA
ncbi:hypothetical protein pdam_00017475 [Pocillopora damicornis]|uniref:Uncharacterized protein n=2 Tax=Pocillopora damicornis TaxID=46731 RepID=A0A3M6TUU1_POCDA|nr:hypothetical protein pdam_00017475 [Pocillopora damicornis]